MFINKSESSDSVYGTDWRRHGIPGLPAATNQNRVASEPKRQSVNQDSCVTEGIPRISFRHAMGTWGEGMLPETLGWIALILGTASLAAAVPSPRTFPFPAFIWSRVSSKTRSWPANE